jgi:hypothetical protein
MKKYYIIDRIILIWSNLKLFDYSKNEQELYYFQGGESKIQNNICILLRSTKVYLFLVQKLWTVGHSLPCAV